jgi:hypothetical protein
MPRKKSLKAVQKTRTQQENGEASLKKLQFASTQPIVKDAMPLMKKYIHEHRNDLGTCPFCDRSIMDRDESIYKELIMSLYRVYRWCGENKTHEFNMKDVRHLIGKIDYPRFGNLHHYGGIVYRPGTGVKKKNNGVYGINMERAREFFRGTRDIPVKRTIDMITGLTIAETRVYVKDIPELKTFIDEDGNYDHRAPVCVDYTAPSKRGLPLTD